LSNLTPCYCFFLPQWTHFLFFSFLFESLSFSLFKKRKKEQLKKKILLRWKASLIFTTDLSMYFSTKVPQRNERLKGKKETWTLFQLSSNLYVIYQKLLVFIHLYFVLCSLFQVLNVEAVLETIVMLEKKIFPFNYFLHHMNFFQIYS